MSIALSSLVGGGLLLSRSQPTLHPQASAEGDATPTREASSEGQIALKGSARVGALDATSAVGELGSTAPLTPLSPPSLAPPEPGSLVNPVPDAPTIMPLSYDPLSGEAREQSPKWEPSRRPERLRAYGMLGQYAAWLKEAEQLGWESAAQGLSLSREGVTLSFEARDGLLARAEARFLPTHSSGDAMELWSVLLGDEQHALSGASLGPFESEEPGWRRRYEATLSSGRVIEVTLEGRATGEPPYGPSRFVFSMQTSE